MIGWPNSPLYELSITCEFKSTDSQHDDLYNAHDNLSNRVQYCLKEIDGKQVWLIERLAPWRASPLSTLLRQTIPSMSHSNTLYKNNNNAVKNKRLLSLYFMNLVYFHPCGKWTSICTTSTMVPKCRLSFYYFILLPECWLGLGSVVFNSLASWVGAKMTHCILYRTLSTGQEMVLNLL